MRGRRGIQSIKRDKKSSQPFIPSQTSQISSTQTDHFVVRKSLAEHEFEALQDEGRSLFFQRVYILAKNADVNKNPVPVAKPIRTTETFMQYQPKRYSTQWEVSPLEDKSLFLNNLRRIVKQCNNESLTFDHITGLYLYMGEYTLLVIEGSEDMLDDFCSLLSTNIDNFWTANKVFLVDDKIDDVYFSKFNTRYAMPININEKFPPSTSNDEYLMAKQHRQIRQKILQLCASLEDEISKNQESTAIEEALPSTYNKMLPEVQRIDLVLNSSRFYRSVQKFALVYGDIPLQNEGDAFIWPLPYTYTPLGVFQRSPFDVNLTFTDYGKIESKKEDANIEEDYKDDQNNPENAQTTEAGSA